jgi:hypothetical protein
MNAEAATAAFFMKSLRDGDNLLVADEFFFMVVLLTLELMAYGFFENRIYY